MFKKHVRGWENTTHIQENTHQFKENGVPMNGHSVFSVIFVRFSKERMEYYNLDSMSMGMRSMVDTAGNMVGNNNNQILDLEPVVHQ